MTIDNHIFWFNFSFKYKRNYLNPIWRTYKKCITFFNKQINCCYNLYYKLKGKQIIDPLIRYQLQRLLDNNDDENKILGISLLITYSAGNDLLRDCMFRMYNDRWDREKGDYKEYYKIGDLQLSENTKIQDIIDKLREVYSSIPEGTPIHEIIFKCNPYLDPIGYWMYYHPRIGSQCCSPLGEFEHCGNPKDSHKEKVSLIESHTFFDTIRTWDWRRQRYDYEVSAKEYWKHHKKPDLSII